MKAEPVSTIGPEIKTQRNIDVKSHFIDEKEKYTTGGVFQVFNDIIVSFLNDVCYVISKYEYQTLENQTIQSYQLQITIHEAKGLKGNRTNPFCSITFNQIKKVTEIKKQTNSPFWDTLFVFDVAGEYMQIARYILHFKVISDNGPFRRNTVLGVFKIDFHTIFNNFEHKFTKKWIRLYAENDRAQKNEPQLCGFLRVSLVVVATANLAYDLVPIGDPPAGSLLLPEAFPTSRSKVAIKVTIYCAQNLNKAHLNFIKFRPNAITLDLIFAKHQYLRNQWKIDS
ncbi:Fer-1-like protein 6 [Thelohanellus kitauei]|uniref:Fer-1-like protein 6 n=1 Tax=Thelohanellus kitauei TaxID=669202 RepID=A0A0C2MSH6_THEKT|nr:Fer-1-like protein 6 [Thelohanellus kitauei]